MKYIAMVREFNAALACGAPLVPSEPTDNQRLVRMQLLHEELSEVIKAVAAGNIVEVLAEMVDLEYVALGGFVIYGADKAGVEIPSWSTNAAGPPRLLNSADAAMMHFVGIGKTVSEVGAMMIGGGDWRSVCTVLLELRGQLANLWTAYRVPDDLKLALFEEVHRANMAKLGGGLSQAGRVQKPEGWTPPDMRKVLMAYGYAVMPDNATLIEVKGGAA